MHSTPCRAGGSVRHGPDRDGVVKEDFDRTRRDIRAALIFGVVAALLELGALLYFFR